MTVKTNHSAESNPAVSRCCNAWRQAYQSALDNGKKHQAAMNEATQAYREALPPLFGVRNIRAYIACIAHGSVLGIIDGPDASRLFYAAQVAFGTRRTRSPKHQDARRSSKRDQSGAAPEPKNAALEPFGALVNPIEASPGQ